MARHRVGRKRRTCTQSQKTKKAISGETLLHGFFSKLSATERELLAYHEFIATGKHSNIVQGDPIQLFNSSVATHLHQVCGVRWTLTSIQRKLKTLFTEPSVKKFDAYGHGTLFITTLPKEVRSWIEQRVSELRLHAFVVSKSQRHSTERLTRSESLVLGTAAQHMSLDDHCETARRRRIPCQSGDAFDQDHHSSRRNSSLNGHPHRSPQDLTPSEVPGKFCEPSNDEPMDFQNISDSSANENLDGENSVQDVVSTQRVESDLLLYIREGFQEGSRVLPVHAATVATCDPTLDDDQMMVRYRNQEVIFKITQINKDHAAEVAALRTQIYCLKEKLTQETREKERHESRYDLREKVILKNVTLEELTEYETLTKGQELEKLEIEVNFLRRQYSFYHGTDQKVVCNERSVLKKTAENLKLKLDHFLNTMENCKVISISEELLDERIIHLAAYCLGVGDRKETYVRLSEYPCDSEALRSLVKALLSSAMISWLFSRPIPEIERQNSALLMKYKQLIRDQNGPQALRCIDHTALYEWLEEEGDLTLCRRTERLTSDFMELILPIFQDQGEWMKHEIDVRSIFKSALELQLRAVMSSQTLEIAMFYPGDYYQDGVMDNGFPKLPDDAKQRVMLCKTPVILAYDDHKDMVDACSFTQNSVEGNGKLLHGETLTKAGVVLEAYSSGSYPQDSEVDTLSTVQR